MDHDLRTRLSTADPVTRTSGYSPERQREITHRIMTEAAPALLQAAAPRPARRRFAVPLATAAAVLVAAGITAGVAGHSGPAPAGAGAITQRLDHIARIAAVHPDVPVGQDQYLYTRSMQAGAELTLGAGGTYTAGPLPSLTTRDSWSPQDPTKKGLYREGTVATVINPQLGGPSADQLTHAQISALPTDPAALLHQVRATLPAGYQDDLDHGAFTVLLGYLAETPPPAVAAALYRAAGLIPGVRIEDGAVDALGRRGVGLVHDANQGNLRDEYVVDPDTATYLGWDQYSVTAGGPSTGGQHVGTGALLESAVVDHIGSRPAS